MSNNNALLIKNNQPYGTVPFEQIKTEDFSNLSSYFLSKINSPYK